MHIRELLITNENARPKEYIKPKGLVIHWTANEGRGADAEANRNYFNRPTTQASCHYNVDDKEIVRCLPEWEMACHVGSKQYKSEAIDKLSRYPNNCTIGIEMCVNSDSDFKAMYQRTIELSADILKRHEWGIEHLWRHFDITGKNCPAFFVSTDKAMQYFGLTPEMAWEKFKQDVRMASNPQQSVDNTCHFVVNGKKLPVNGFIDDGRSYIPVRAYAETFAPALKVEWDSKGRKISLQGKMLKTSVVREQANGTSLGFAMVKELKELFGITADWDQVTKTVTIKGGN